MEEIACIRSVEVPRNLYKKVNMIVGDSQVHHAILSLPYYHHPLFPPGKLPLPLFPILLLCPVSPPASTLPFNHAVPLSLLSPPMTLASPVASFPCPPLWPNLVALFGSLPLCLMEIAKHATPPLLSFANSLLSWVPS